MTFSVAVAGASGYAGGELLRLLAAHPDLEVTTVTANQNAGQRLVEVAPHLRSLAHLTLVETTADTLAGHDVVFLALPHGKSGSLSATLPDDTLVVDCGADHRLTSEAAWARFYGGEYFGAWAYGLPELLLDGGAEQRSKLTGARRIAVPGCNVTAITLALAPGIRSGVIAADDIVAVLAVGASGAGRSSKPELSFSELSGSAGAYAVGGIHRHNPEIVQNLTAAGGVGVTVSFTPVLVPMSRGILATSTAKLAAGVEAADVRSAWEAAYDHEPFVHVLPDGSFPRSGDATGANSALIGVTVDAASGRVVTITAIDNLVKGTAGAAIQSANIALGLDETAGLATDGVAPVSVTGPRGFSATGISIGLKRSGGLDLAIVHNLGPSRAAAAVFTSNRAKANPIIWSQRVIVDGIASAIVLNSGGANCYTGAAGFQVTHATAEAVAAKLDVSATDVLVCSTGLIGDQLPLAPILAGVADAVLTGDGGADAALAIMTTDSRPKTVVVERDGWSIGGMAKGAGMLAPGLATMLVVITTDVDLPPASLDAALRAATAVTFDRLDSDGCMSTNDQVTLLASGASAVSPSLDEFTGALTEACDSLAAQLQADAEGSSHDIDIETVNAATVDDALEVSRAVARNNLFKAAVFGNDPNWGRVLAAVGTTRADFDPYGIDVTINGVRVCRDGEPGEPRDLVDLAPRAVHVLIDLKVGTAAATVRTNDLTHEYVHENSAYSS